MKPSFWLLPPDPGTLRKMRDDNWNRNSFLILFAIFGLLAMMAKEIQ